MERVAIDAREVADAILSAPGWARIGITVPNEHLREKAALEVALAVVEHFDPPPADAGDQYRLAL